MDQYYGFKKSEFRYITFSLVKIKERTFFDFKHGNHRKKVRTHKEHNNRLFYRARYLQN